MDNIEFLRSILGDEGYYCIVGLKKDCNPIQKFYGSIEGVISSAENFKDEGFDAYFALSTFVDGKSRRVTNVHQLRSLFLDLDCGPNKPYESKKEAATALLNFCTDIGLPVPHMVNSGGGIHVYWPFTTPASKEEWAPIAERLKTLCTDYGLHADPVVTADAARILRIPGTFNFKTETPREVKLVKVGEGPFTIDSLRDIIGEEFKPTKSFTPKGEMDEMTRRIMGNFTKRFKTILSKSLHGTGCAQIAYMFTNQEDGIPEPLWRAGLSIAKFCVDGKTAARKISEKDPRYSLEDTLEKMRGVKEGPYLCTTIEKDFPDRCRDCPLKGKISTPLMLGLEVQEASDEDNIVEDTPENVDQGHTQSYVIPTLPAPYFRGKNGGIYKRIKKEGDEVEVLIYHNDLYVTRRVHDPEAGESIVIRLHLPIDGVREFTVPLTAVTSKEELRKHLAMRGIAVAKTDEIVNYLTAWVNHMQFKAKSDIARRQFGWTDKDYTSFVIGDKEVFADRVEHNPPSTTTSQLIPAFEPKGSFEEWKSIMQFYSRPGMELHQFIIGLSIGSIFTDFTPIHAALLHVYSQESGLGKTTTAYAGLSIWGDPARLAMKESDTYNSKMLRMELMKNVFVVFDELTNMLPKDASDLLYQVTSGSQKNRMTTSANQERVRGLPWNLSAVSTGNSSLTEIVKMYKTFPKGEGMRVLEARVKPVPGLDKQVTDELSTKIDNNYGHAAIPLLQCVMRDIAGAKALHKQWQNRLDKLLGFGQADRFHSVLVADAVTGIHLGNLLGFFDFKIPNIINWVSTTVQESRESAANFEASGEEILSAFLAENWSNTLTIKSRADRRAKNGGLDHLIEPATVPKNFVIRYEDDIKMLYIFRDPLVAWCGRRKINFDGFIDALRKGSTNAKFADKLMSKGTAQTLPKARVLWVNCEGFMTEERENEFARRASQEESDADSGEGDNTT